MIEEFNIEKLYTRYSSMVYRRCLKLLGNEEKALEAMQDTFIKLINNKNSLKNNYPSALLFRIATNHSLNIIKKEKINNNLRNLESNNLDKNSINLVINYLNDSGVNINFENKELIYNVFKGLKEKYFEIAVLYFLDGMTLFELSKELGMSVSGVRKVLNIIKERANIIKVKEDSNEENS